MSKVPIKNKLYIFSATLPLIIALLAVVMYWLYAGMASNVNFTNTDNVLLKSLPHITHYLHILLDIAFIAASISVISYARSYFGPSTSAKTALIAISTYAVSEIFSYCFSVVYNSFNSADFKAKLISVAFELIYIGLLVFICPLLTRAYVNHTIKKDSKPSRLKLSMASSVTIGIYFIIKLAELVTYTISAVKDFLNQGNAISSSLIISIMIDVVYYIVLYLAVPVSIALLVSYVLTRYTGTLKLKIKGDS